MSSASQVRGNVTWTPEQERPKALAIYRENFENPEPQHEQVFTRFNQRKAKTGGPVLNYDTIGERLGENEKKMIDGFQQVQLANAQHRQARKQEKRRKEKVKQAAEEATEGANVKYDGDVNQCAVCFDHFIKDQLVSRLMCRHILHEKCLKEYWAHAKVQEPVCPECRWTYQEP